MHLPSLLVTGSLVDEGLDEIIYSASMLFIGNIRDHPV